MNEVEEILGKRHKRMLTLAIKEANKSNSHAFKIGAVAFRGRRNVAKAHNDIIKTSPGTTNRSRAIHAEYALAHSDIAGTDVLIVRITPAGKLAMARPCLDCYPLLAPARRIFYSDRFGHIRRLR